MYTYNKVRPRNREAARIWNRYNNSDTWDWIQIRYWPKDIAEAVINRKLKYGTRFRVMIYLVGNGMDPAMARNEVLKMGVGYFDASAKQHVRDLWKDLKKNSERWSYWDERERKILFLADTGFGGRKKSVKANATWKSLNEMLKRMDSERHMTINTEAKVPRLGTYKKIPIWEDGLDSDAEV